jgi:CheY-like chemotaxis protein
MSRFEIDGGYYEPKRYRLIIFLIFSMLYLCNQIQMSVISTVRVHLWHLEWQHIYEKTLYLTGSYTMTDFFKLLLADDDLDDCLLFREALSELPLTTSLTVVNDGEGLLKILALDSTELPDIIFLDLNMPRKNGMECLCEIKSSPYLHRIQVVIFSTSVNEELTSLLLEKGAARCISKPSSYPELKEAILDALLQLPLNPVVF